MKVRSIDVVGRVFVPRRAMALALSMGIATTAFAQVYDTPPPPSAPRPLQIAPPQEQTLPNGLRVVVAERRGLPLVSAALLILSGNEVDPPQRGGLASMTAGLLTQGTRRHSAPQIAATAEALGGTLESAAGWDRSTISMTVTTPKLDAALALIGEVVTEPTFRQSELDRLRAQTIDELKVAYAKPGTLASLVAARMLFGDGTYGNPPGGTPASLARLGRDDVRRLYRGYYRPDNAVLVLAGDIDLPAAMAVARRRFGGWKGSVEPRPVAAVPTGDESAQTITVVDMGATGQAGVVLALPLAAGGSTEQTIGDVTNAVLGGGYGSRLNQEIRVRRGLSYGAGSRVDERRQGGFVRASVQTKNESAAEVVALVRAEFDRIARSEVDADELAARKATLIGNFSRSVETTAGLAAQVAAMVAHGRSPSQLPSRIEQLDAVGADQVQSYAQSHYTASRRRIAVAGDASRFEGALKATAPDLVSIRQEQLDLDR